MRRVAAHGSFGNEEERVARGARRFRFTRRVKAMPRTFEGHWTGGDARFGVVVARFNEEVTVRLLEGALETLRGRGVRDEQIDVVWVPGAFEIPLAARRLLDAARYAAVLCLGAVVRGETTHHEYINQQVSAGIMKLGLETGVPVLYGVLNCDTWEQAVDRAGGRMGNKGSETAEAALEMAALLERMPTGK